MRNLPGRVLAWCFALGCAGALADEPPGPAKDPDHPTLAGVQAVDDAHEAARRLAVAPGLRADLWAAEPQLENPVSFCFDERGRCYVAETSRRRTSALDIRQHRPWLLESLAMRTVGDRLTFLQKAFLDQKAAPYLGLVDRNHDGRLDWRDLAVESEKIRRLEDRTGAGRAEVSAVFAEGFNSAVTGLGAGVLARDGDVYFTCLPDLWKLPAEGGERKREALLSGFGVHITYSGHDLHGLAFGPDGKLYWTVGDCGAHVVTKEGSALDLPDTGAVFRANPDGSECEVVMRGLRNPEELCFNDVGDLFTADNNADNGDPARWVQVVEGGDAGWTIGWQALPGLGAWNEEKLWSPDTAQTALALLPPIGALGHGPAGIACYPGTGLPEQWRDHFFVCDFPGGVRTFTQQPRGAGYALDASQQVLQDNGYTLDHKLAWGFYPTDVDFSVDGGVYVLDWVQDVEKPGKGRIFRLHDPATDASPLVQETRTLLAGPMQALTSERLIALLDHADRRVRMAAQAALVAKGAAGALGNAAKAPGPVPGRLHAIWGLGQLGRKSPSAFDLLITLLGDAESEVRAQSAKVLSWAPAAMGTRNLIAALADSAPRVRAFAALALARHPSRDALPALLAMLGENGAGDAIVRHAGVMALAQCANPGVLEAAAGDASEAVRAGVLLAMRRQGRREVARFLRDASPQLVLEAARAIYDSPIEAALPELAALVAQADLEAPVFARALEANFALGDASSALRLAALATSEAPESRRVQAVEALGQWNLPLGRDRFLGIWRPLSPTRESQAPTVALLRSFSALLSPRAGERVERAAIAAAAQLRFLPAEGALASIAGDGGAAGSLRVAALDGLVGMASPRALAVLHTCLNDAEPTVRARALELEARLQPENAVASAAHALATGNTEEKQSAVRALREIKGAAADKEIAKWLERFLGGQAPRAMQLDLLEAAADRGTPELRKLLARVDAGRGQGLLSPWRECLEGGDATRGRQIFCEKAEAGCLRCHKVRGFGGEVGPDLSSVGARHDRVFILRSIVNPNQDIAPGYESLLLTLKDGRELAGIVQRNEAGTLWLRSLADGKEIAITAADIVRRSRLPSAMPEGLGQVLGKRDLRDVVEFLAGLK